MTSRTPVISSLRELRQARGLSQLALAQQAGVSRQALCALEAGTTIPGTDLALRLAWVLGGRVEAIFRLDEERPEVEARMAGSPEEVPAGAARRVVLGEIDGQWVAHPIDPRDPEALAQAADGVIARGRRGRRGPVRIEPLGDLEAAQRRLIVMGCAPALGLLGVRLGEGPAGVPMSWIQGPSVGALAALRRREIHVAGIHVFVRRGLRAVQRPLRRPAVCRPRDAAGEPGVLGAGTAARARQFPRDSGVADLLRPRVRFVAREAGAGAHALLERALRDQGARASQVRSLPRVARGHMEDARIIAAGQGDAGIATRGAALAHGLDFIPLAEERFDLVFSRTLASDPRIERLVEVLGSRAFRREIDCVGGYCTAESGQQAGETRPAGPRASSAPRRVR